jgi:parallel beta-helix repeat protein
MRDHKTDSRVSVARREFMRRSLLLGMPSLLLQSLGVTSLAMAAPSQSTNAAASISVRDKGAMGDGSHDDTDAFQAAIDALPASGGTVVVPPGNYMIDAARAINLRSNMLLQMAPTAQLSAIPNHLPRSHVIKVWRVNNVQIVGGRIVGERNGHLGTTGEWGYGLNISGSSKVSVSDMHIADCWGDGVLVGAIGSQENGIRATDVTLTRVISTNNRRQGLTIGPVNGVMVIDSTFSDSHGTKPEAGVDMEPQTQGLAQNVSIIRCTISGNHGTGLEMHEHVVGVVIKHCTIRDNNGYGVLSAGASQITIAENTVSENGLVGVTIGGTTSHAQINGNTLSGNSSHYFRRLASALASPSTNDQSRDLRVDATTSDVTVSGNNFSP